MFKALIIVIPAVAIIAAGMVADVAVAHHNVYHSIGQCGSAVCPAKKPTGKTETKTGKTKTKKSDR